VAPGRDAPIVIPASLLGMRTGEWRNSGLPVPEVFILAETSRRIFSMRVA
jgi:hypothetical protein